MFLFENKLIKKESSLSPQPSNVFISGFVFVEPQTQLPREAQQALGAT